MARRLRAFDWGAHPLGDPSGWPDELKTMLVLCLQSSVPTAIYWGPELRLIYNDAWAHIPAERHPAAIGKPAAEVWSDIWDVVGPQFQSVLDTRRGFSTDDQMLRMARSGRVEETYWTYSFTPIADREMKIVGVLNQGHETTEKVLASRDQAFLLDLGDRLRALGDGEFDAPAVLSLALGALGRHLGLARVGYATVDEASDYCSVVANWREESMSDIAAGRYRLADFGEAARDEIMAGRPAASDDVAQDPAHSAEVKNNFLALGVRANLVAPVMRRGRAAALLFLNDRQPRRWTPRQTDLARDAADRIWNALERAESLAKVRASERRFAAIYDQAAVGLSEVDQDGRFIRFNESMGRIIGRSPADARRLTIADVTHPEDIAESRAHILDPVRSRQPFQIEKRYVRPDKSVVWAVTQVTQLIDEHDRPSGFFSVTTDITERKEEERIRAWLLAELNHRVKNNLSTVQALARQTRQSVDSLDEFEAAFNARLMALSRAHDLLMRETWTSAGLGELAAATLAPFKLDDDARIVIRGPEVRFSPTAAVTMTLAFHELATNSAKFGALSMPGGRVTVEWLIDTSRNGGVVDLRWREAGGPIVPPPSRRGFGLRLIERGAPRELGGDVRLDFEPDGVACAFRLPLSQKITAP
ncbi:PAS domain S-box protein [Chelatococcus sambhunathii]|uniref:Blue-light-activated histidine kinase n=1 Tax=Chelatococcus sambhunathii TaxID=363953 RepID=A0ABU1DKE2_9HYPH|nr:HWE histidine kinase domain-containing protein [Chelatococcus sambhunathii]MDR4308541.1 PAS domain S-box protein [Chelatococcus sambhunathii]